MPVRKHPDVCLFVSERIWRKYLRLGFSPSISLDRNGGGFRYARTMAWLPSPGARRPVAIALARIFVVIDARLSERALPNKGWTVSYRNGDHLDLRIENLVVVHQVARSKGRRNSFYASWTVSARSKIVRAGGDPKAVLAAQRRAFRDTHKTAILDDPKPYCPPSPRPHKERRRGKP